MKVNSYRSACGGLFAASLFLVTPASAAFLLAGAHSFEGTSPLNISPEAADVTHPGFSGTVFKTNASLSTGGSSDGTYGPGTASGHGGHTYPGSGAGDDGSLQVGSVAATQFLVDSSSNVPKTLTALLFDASVNNMRVSYTLGSDIIETTLAPTTVTSTSGGFFNYEVDLSGLGLELAADAASSINFFFRSTTGIASLDNVALTAIPEPSSLAVLGCLVGSGVFLRSRSRKKVAAA